MTDREQGWLRLPGRAARLLREAGTLIEEARLNGADLHPCARHFLQQAEVLLASGRIEMSRDDARLAATFAQLAFEEAGKAIALCGSARRTSTGSSPRRGISWR